ncbi:jg13095 [Pararge aegeria aegeria]|uniref:Jg13095 protein n=1 Tax=Pararge aegeria aegeria TaxID=348720 RepID=A0A8S4RNV2_9NEOP|nr:jg13095 [Pararge aegeria aegeria]
MMGETYASIEGGNAPHGEISIDLLVLDVAQLAHHFFQLNHLSIGPQRACVVCCQVKSSGLAAESLPEILNTPCPAVTITAARARNSGAAGN